MGHGEYSVYSASVRADSSGYHTKSTNEVFKQRSINSKMSPHGITVIESRDSAEHPLSTPIIIALDVTGSMGSIPHYLIKEGLPHIMDQLIKAGISDPQVLFIAIGDHECDQSPLQVGQFESSDELLDYWLKNVWLESGGGGNYGESYLLAWQLAGRYTDIDSFNKRKERGWLFTIGDEPTLSVIPIESQQSIFGDGQYSTATASELLELAQKRYHCKHLHIMETSSGRRPSVLNGWKQLMADDVIAIERKNDVAVAIADTIIKGSSNVNTVGGWVVPEPNIEPSDKPTKIIL